MTITDKFEECWSGAREAERFLGLIFGTDQGWLEVSAIKGDPDDRRNCRFIQKWVRYHPEGIANVLQTIYDLYRMYGNVYCSVTLYDKPMRTKNGGNALPGRAVFVDDAPPAPGAYSVIVQTGTGKPQAWVVLDKSVSAEERERLARNLASSGGDPSGWDTGQLARIPGTFNTKRRHGGAYDNGAWIAGTGHRVRLIQADGPTYTQAEALARWPVPEPDSKDRGLSNGDLSVAALMGLTDEQLRERVDSWLTNIEQLHESPRYQAILWSSAPNAPVLRGVRGGYFKDGTWRDSDSDQRAIVAYLLAFFRYPPDELIALLLTCPWWTNSRRKGETWMWDDAWRLAAMAYENNRDRFPLQPTRFLGGRRDVGAHPAPSHQAGATVRRAVPDAPPSYTPTPPPERPSACTAERLLRWAHEHAAGFNADGHRLIMLSQHQLANALQVSKSTIERRERELTRAGLVRRETTRAGKRTHSRLVLLAETVPAPLTPNGRSEVSSPEVRIEETHARVFPHESTHPSELPPSNTLARSASLSLQERQQLAALVREAFDACQTRIHIRAVLHYVRANGGAAHWPEAVIRQAYDVELTTRKRQRDKMRWRRWFARMPLAALKRYATKQGRFAEQQRQRNHPQWRFFMWRAGQAEAEITRRSRT